MYYLIKTVLRITCLMHEISLKLTSTNHPMRCMAVLGTLRCCQLKNILPSKDCYNIKMIRKCLHQRG